VPHNYARGADDQYSISVLPGEVPEAILNLAGHAYRAWWRVIYHETPRALEKAQALAEQAREIIAELRRSHT
jgi:hypothetical protein